MGIYFQLRDSSRPGKYENERRDRKITSWAMNRDGCARTYKIFATLSLYPFFSFFFSFSFFLVLIRIHVLFYRFLAV